jgi:hypothetical protein
MRGRRRRKILPYTIIISDPTESQAAQAIVAEFYFVSISKNRTLLMTIQKESEGLPTPAVEREESEPSILHCDDFVLLNDAIKCWIVRIENISLLEAWCNGTSFISWMTGFSFGAPSETASAGWRIPLFFAPAAVV